MAGGLINFTRALEGAALNFGEKDIASTRQERVLRVIWFPRGMPGAGKVLKREDVSIVDIPIRKIPADLLAAIKGVP